MPATTTALHHARRVFVAAALPWLLITAVLPGQAYATEPDHSRANATLAEKRAAATAELEQRAVDLQQQALDAAQALTEAREHAERLSAHSARLTEQAERAAQIAGASHQDSSAQRDGGLVDTVSSWMRGGDPEVDAAVEAVTNQQHAQQLAAHAAAALDDAQQTLSAAHQARAAADAEVAKIQAEIASSLAGFDASYRVGKRAQDTRNRKAVRRWNAYLTQLADARVIPPPARDMRDPDELRRPLRPLRDDKQRVITGFAQVRQVGDPPLTVLPAETIRAVSTAFSKIGLADSRGPDYACGGLTRQVWRAAGLRLPAGSAAQSQQLRTLPRARIQVGDMVFLGHATVDALRVGIYVGNNQVIAADPASNEVGVQQIPRPAMHGIARVTTPANDPKPGARPVAAPSSAVCGPPDLQNGENAADAADVDSDDWTPPIAEDRYTLSAGFGRSGILWSSGQHSGQDFAAPVGTPVVAARGGTVSVQTPAWAGNLIIIDHGDGFESWYAHLSEVSVEPGQRVSTGDVVGAVGDEGNSTGPHLHFEIRMDGEALDPMPLLGLAPIITLSTGSAMWGGHSNGAIPDTALCQLAGSSHQLRCDAATAYRQLDQAYYKQFGKSLCITDSYRSLHAQEQLFTTKPDLAAVPGTSNHGWALAVDLCGGVEQFGTAQHEWVTANGPRFGWHHPSWAGSTGSRPEPWHFEFGHIS